MSNLAVTKASRLGLRLGPLICPLFDTLKRLLLSDLLCRPFRYTPVIPGRHWTNHRHHSSGKDDRYGHFGTTRSRRHGDVSARCRGIDSRNGTTTGLLAEAHSPFGNRCAQATTLMNPGRRSLRFWNPAHRTTPPGSPCRYSQSREQTGTRLRDAGPAIQKKYKYAWPTWQHRDLQLKTSSAIFPPADRSQPSV